MEERFGKVQRRKQRINGAETWERTWSSPEEHQQVPQFQQFTNGPAEAGRLRRERFTQPEEQPASTQPAAEPRPSTPDRDRRQHTAPIEAAAPPAGRSPLGPATTRAGQLDSTPGKRKPADQSPDRPGASARSAERRRDPRRHPRWQCASTAKEVDDRKPALPGQARTTRRRSRRSDDRAKRTRREKTRRT